MKFVENTLKSNYDHPPPTITGNWSILEAVIDGNLNQVLINNLNLVDDVVHNVNNDAPYVIRAPKMMLKGATIDNLMADHTSVLNKIPLGKWINDAVYLYENYTIHGTTTISSLNVFNDIQVMGTLNNVTFHEDHLFLQDRKQILPKNLRITSHLKDEKRFLTNNIDNLYVDFINSEYMPKLMDSLIPWASNTEISSHVVFKEIVNVDNYCGPDNAKPNTRWQRSLDDTTTESSVDTDTKIDVENFKSLQGIERYLLNITKGN